MSLSCRDMGNDYTFDDPNGVQVRCDVSSMFLTNKTVETAYYFAVERQTSAVVDWIPACLISRSVPAGRTIEVPYTQIIGYKKGCEVLLYWWHCSGTMLAAPGAMKPMLLQTP